MGRSLGEWLSTDAASLAFSTWAALSACSQPLLVTPDKRKLARKIWKQKLNYWRHLFLSFIFKKKNKGR